MRISIAKFSQRNFRNLFSMEGWLFKRLGVANDCVIEGERSMLRCLRKLYLIPLLYCFASLNEICYTTEAKEIVAKCLYAIKNILDMVWRHICKEAVLNNR